MKNLLLIRHAESENNAGLTDNLNSCLTQKGWRQATRLSKFLEKNFDLSTYKGFVSPFLRCLQTAVFIQNNNKIEFSINTQVREHSLLFPEYGVEIGNRSSDFADNFIWKEKEDFFFPKEASPDIIKRLQNFIEVSDNAIVISHGTPVQIMAEMACGKIFTEVPAWKNEILNASVTYIKEGELIWLGQLITE